MAGNGSHEPVESPITIRENSSIPHWLVTTPPMETQCSIPSLIEPISRAAVVAMVQRQEDTKGIAKPRTSSENTDRCIRISETCGRDKSVNAVLGCGCADVVLNADRLSIRASRSS